MTVFNTPAEVQQKIARNAECRERLGRGEVGVRTISSAEPSEEATAWLLELKGIFQKQLPKMPKEYVARLVFDMKHKSMVLLDSQRLVGGICFRLFHDESFAEIVFCAVSSDSQIRGYGEFMMNMFKHTARQEFAQEHRRRGGKGAYPHSIYLMTYADNYALGYFRKQGFTKSISFQGWKGRIKDYEGGTLMQGRIIKGVDYANVYKYAEKRRGALQDTIRKAHPEMAKAWPGIEGMRLGRVVDIPGLEAAGYDEGVERAVGGRRELKELLSYLCTELQNHATAWPFLEPVSARDVADYYSVIKRPMDLKTIEAKIAGDKYRTFEQMDADFRQMIENCYAYNAPGTQYVKCARMLNDFYQKKAKSCRSSLLQHAGRPQAH